MKRKICILLTFLILSVLLSCNNQEEYYQYSGENSYGEWFFATIIEVNENSIVVEPYEDTLQRKTSDKISVSTIVSEDFELPDLKENIDVIVCYTGEIAESYPAQITQTKYITKAFDFDVSTWPYVDSIDSIEYDIDKDGNTEVVKLGYGPTSGLFTFVVSVWNENNEIEASQVYYLEHSKLSFYNDGESLFIKVNDQTNNTELHCIRVSVTNGEIHLEENGEALDSNKWN
ncbi:MAG: hypothetical protein IJ400_00145 [Clostridia bacterium]|nr:hypothetical protein [Clostridia bacterium]